MNSTAVIIVDHGSRRLESNQMLEEVARLFGERFASQYAIVEPAHMELCEPSIASAFARCVMRGATRVVVVPFFLGPGKHWTRDIPALTLEASESHPGVAYHVAPPLGVDELILDLLAKRANHCATNDYRCDLCRGTLRSGEADIVREVELKAAHGQSTVCSTCPYKGQPLPQAAAAG